MAKKVNISFDEKLLKRLDNYADANYLTRSGLVTVAVNQYLTQRETLVAINRLSIAFKRIADSGKVDEKTMADLKEFSTFMDLLVKNNKLLD